MALFLKPDPADIRAARRDIHREALIRGVASIAQSAQPAAVTALSELLDEGVVTRRGDRGVAIADDTDVYRAARAIMLELESGGGTLSVEGLHDRIEHTAPTTHTALNYLRAHKLVALRDGVLTDRTGDKMRGRKSALPTESLELAAIAAADAAVRKNIAALGDSTTRWFKHPDDDRWTPEALRDIRRETNAVYRVLPPGRRMTVDKFRYEVRKVTADHVDEVMARLEAAKFITVTDSTVTTHAALPVPEVPKTEKPETVTPAPTPIAVAAGGDVGDLASFSGPETPNPDTKPAPEVVEQKPEPEQKPAGDTNSSAPDPKPEGTVQMAKTTTEVVETPETKVPEPAKSGVPETTDTVSEGTGAASTEAPDPAPKTTTNSGTSAPKTTNTKGTSKVSPTVSAPETTKSVTIGDQILGEVRELRRDVRQALAPITAPKTDPQPAAQLLAASDPMTRKVLVRVVVCLHVRGEMTRTALRKTMNGKRATYLPEAIRLGLRLGVLDANAQDGKALRLIDHSKVISTADLERLAAEQRERDGGEEDNGLLGGIARTLVGAVS